MARTTCTARQMGRWRVLGVVACLAGGVVRAADAQTATAPTRKPELTGTLGREAARALGDPWQQSRTPSATPSGPTRRPPARVHGRWGGGVLLDVEDAPGYGRGGSTLLVEPVSPPVVSAPSWYPTMQPPVWHLVRDEHPVQAWRVIDVEDVVCSSRPAGADTCSTVTTRMLARWVPALRGYAFVDRVGRMWQVE